MALARWRHRFGVERSGNAALRVTVNVRLENPANDRGVFGHDFKFASLARNGAITVGSSAGVSAVANHTGHTPTDHHFQIFKIVAVDYRLDAVHQSRDYAIDGRHDRNVMIGEALADRGAIFLVATDAAHCLSDHDAELSVGSRV